MGAFWSKVGQEVVWCGMSGVELKKVREKGQKGLSALTGITGTLRSRRYLGGVRWRSTPPQVKKYVVGVGQNQPENDIDRCT